MTDMRRVFDWPSMLKLAVREGGMRPQDFWALTPAELGLILGLDDIPKPLNRARLAELEAMYSDMKREG